MDIENPKLIIAESFIPRAGMGLFAKERIANNELLGEYKGQRIPFEETRASESPYLAQLNARTAVDAGIGGNELRFINSPRGTNLRPNTKFVKPRNQDRLYIRSTRPITPGTEILIGYGSRYWIGHPKTAGQPTTLARRVNEILDAKANVHTARGVKQDNKLTNKNQVRTVQEFRNLNRKKRKRTDITGYDVAGGLCQIAEH